MALNKQYALTLAHTAYLCSRKYETTKKEQTMSWELIATVLTALGGWEGVKYFLNRKTNKRKEEAEADSAEFGVLRETVEFLQQQLKNMVEQDAEKEKRFVEQTNRLRETQDREHKLMIEKAQLELDLQKYRCVVPKCMNREPQNGY